MRWPAGCWPRPVRTIILVSELRGLIVDFYGVLTDGIDTAMRAWSDLDDIDYSHFQDAMAEWFGDFGGFEARFNPVHALERGEMEVPDFEAELARRLTRRDGSPPPAEGLVERMFSRFVHAPDMTGLVRRARAVGIQTALLSNSWGDQYLRDGWQDMFDVVVISGEVGMRKPERDIFELTLSQLGQPPSACVFVDDHHANIRAAAALGLVGVWHQTYEETAAELEVLFGRSLAR
jgi:putative hydrolase of the HAD superfamily